MTEKEGGIVKKGHENGNFSSQRIWTPSRASPPSWCYRSGVCEVEHQFKTIDVLVNYDTEIHGYIEKMKIKKLKGVKTKDLIFRPPVIEIKVDETSSEKIHFRSVAGFSKTLPVEAFLTAHTAKKSTLCRIFSLYIEILKEMDML